MILVLHMWDKFILSLNFCKTYLLNSGLVTKTIILIIFRIYFLFYLLWVLNPVESVISIELSILIMVPVSSPISPKSYSPISFMT